MSVDLIDSRGPSRRGAPDQAALDRRRLRRLVRSALRGEDLGDARSVTVVISGDRQVSDLCARFLGRARRTDVLAFPGDGPDLGEVVVNADRARREARRRAIDPEAELFLYVVHGLLHLVGYDDQTTGETRRMRAREAAVLKRFGFPAVFDAPVRRLGPRAEPTATRVRRTEGGRASA